MIAKRRWSGLFGASALVLGIGIVGPDRGAAAQGLTPDPYNIVGEYNGQYAPYMYAVQPPADAMFPNMSRLQERPGARSSNRFQSYVDSLDGLDSDTELPSPLGRRAGLGIPYYRAFRQYDSDFGRVYRPNEAVDRAYYNGLNDRNSRYFDAMREQNPRKRAQLLREYNMEKLRAARDLSTTRNAGERDSDQVAPRPPTRRAPGLDTLLEPEKPAGGTTRRAPAPSGGSRTEGARSSNVIGPVEPRPSTTTRSPSRRTTTTEPLGRSASEILERSERMRRGEPLVPRAPRPSRDVAPPPR